MGVGSYGALKLIYSGKRKGGGLVFQLKNILRVGFRRRIFGEFYIMILIGWRRKKAGGIGNVMRNIFCK